MISYSALTTYGKATLPDVESVNIIRDPPRSIHTRRIDKVGDTSALAATLADSSDRFCEGINYYARGVNPMVSVMYNNTSGGQQAYLPYRVNVDGSFRPPVLTDRDLMPLSRQPRVWTSVKAQPVIEDLTKQVYNCDLNPENSRQLRDKLRYQCESRQLVESGKSGHCDDPTRNRRLIKDDVLTPGVCASKTSQFVRDIENMEKYYLDKFRLNDRVDRGRDVSSNKIFDKTDIITRDNTFDDSRMKLNIPIATVDRDESSSIKRVTAFDEDRPLFNRIKSSANCNKGEYEARPEKPVVLVDYKINLMDRSKFVGR